MSTVGLIPEMRRFARETEAQLALSLHATEEATRSAIVPANNKHSLADLVATLQDLFPKGVKKGPHGRHVLVEYVMLAGVNDTLEDAGTALPSLSLPLSLPLSLSLSLSLSVCLCISSLR